MAGYVLYPGVPVCPATEGSMSEHRSTNSKRPELLPWQAALMVACVTAAGLLHEHPGVMRPLVPGAHPGTLRSSVEPVKHSAEVLNATIWPER